MIRAKSDERTALAAVLVDPDSPFEMRRIELHLPGPGEILVRVACCTICGSDVHARTGRRQADFLPAIVGHEIAGVVEEIGPAPPEYWSGGQIAVGDRVTFSMMASCGTCYYCSQAALPQKCESLFKYGHTACTGPLALTGGLSEYVYLVRGTSIYKLPDTVTNEVAATAMCAGATLVHAFEGTPEIGVRSVVLIGMGMLGLWGIRTAIENGITRILCLDIDEERLAFALESGASDVLGTSGLSSIEVEQRVSSILGGHGPDLVIELSGTPSGVEAAYQSVRTGGRLGLVGSVIPTRPLEIDPYEIVRRTLQIQGIHNYRPEHLEIALKFAENAEHHRALLNGISEPVPLVSVDSAFEDAIRHKAHRIQVTS